MPLQGALNAVVYGWSLPSIRDVYRAMLLGTHGMKSIGSDDRLLSRQSSYSPPQPDRGIALDVQPYVIDDAKPPTHAVAPAAAGRAAAQRRFLAAITSDMCCDGGTGGAGRMHAAVEAAEAE